jgi:hypothetical protein
VRIKLTIVEVIVINRLWRPPTVRSRPWRLFHVMQSW